MRPLLDSKDWHPGFVDVWTVDVKITKLGVTDRFGPTTYTFRCNPSHFLSMLNDFGRNVMIAEGEEPPS